MNLRNEYEKLYLRLKQALLECEKLREENRKLSTSAMLLDNYELR